MCLIIKGSGQKGGHKLEEENTHCFLRGIRCAIRQLNSCPSSLRSRHFLSQLLHSLVVDVEYFQVGTWREFGLEVAGHLESLGGAQSVLFRGLCAWADQEVLTIWPKPMKA